MSDIKLPKKSEPPTTQHVIVRQNAMTRAVEILSSSAMMIDFNNEQSYLDYMNKLFLVAGAIETDYWRDLDLIKLRG